MKDVSWRRNGTMILQNINWSVRPGENWAIIGLNGSGKTSLLNMISGYAFPSKGKVEVLGQRFGACDLRELRKSIGWVSSSLQENLHAGDTAVEIVLSGKFASIGLYDKVTNRDFTRAAELLKQFGCADFLKRRYSTLSQGEKQKILLARSLMSSPKLLILDEPCTGLDLFARESFLSLIEQIGVGEDAPTLLYVSHHIGEILQVFTHTLLLRDGIIHSSGKTKEILTESNLIDFFKMPIEFSWRDGRPWIRVKIQSSGDSVLVNPISAVR
jgi:iron complex transport system ATP-binding protein